MRLRLAPVINSGQLFLAGIAMIISFLFQPNLMIRWLLVTLFMLLSVLSGKRIKITPNIIMIAGIVVVNLINPLGKVLFSLFGFSVTEGALRNGLERSVLLIGMIYISRFTVRPDLRLPGKAGSLFSLVFYYFERILEGEKLSQGGLIRKIDERILAVHATAVNFEGADCTALEPIRTNFFGYLSIILLLVINWGLLLISR